MTERTTLSCIRKCISRLQKSFHNNPVIYLNESDLQCGLFAMLLEDFGSPSPINKVEFWGTSQPKSANQIISRRLHSELLLPEGRIDLAILDLENVKFAMNSKGRNGYVRLDEGHHVFIEIKASRTNRSSITAKKTWKELIDKDLMKLSKYPYRCFMLCFDFQDILNDGEIEYISGHTSSNVELIYCKSKFGHTYLADS